jgi:ubiquitin carboxyl-terminal hydrolase 14
LLKISRRKMSSSPPPSTISVKWNKQLFSNVPLGNTSDELKTHLQQLTGVPPDRQTLMLKQVWKGALGNGINFNQLPWTTTTTEQLIITMMGTPTSNIPVPPTSIQNTVFVEDLTPAQSSAAGASLPSGLENLGNTCYLNSTLQLLRAAPEFSNAIVNMKPPSQSAGEDVMIAKELKSLWSQLQRSHKAISPLTFVAAVRSVFPRFNEQGPRGGFIQQDADDFFNELMSSLSRTIKTSEDKNAVDDLFGVGFKVKSRCVESQSEPETIEKDRQLRLVCIINDKVSHLETGLKLFMEDEITKQSPSLGRDAIYHRTRRISRLPKYLTVQLNRFFWKLTPDSMDHRGVNCKILRAVKFPQTLDVFDLCDENLQQVLSVQRDAKIAKEFNTKNSTNNKDVEMSTTTTTTSSTSSNNNNNNNMDIVLSEEDAEIQRALALSLAPPTLEPSAFDMLGSGIPVTFGGRYELVAVVSHKGRASNSGHYMGWTKQNNGKWVCFDDEHPSECTWEDVERLAGGGDHHMAYLVLYRALG